MVLTMENEVWANDTQMVFNAVFSNGWGVTVMHSLNGFGHIYVEDKTYSVAIIKPSENYADYSTVGTAEEVLKIIKEVREYEEGL